MKSNIVYLVIVIAGLVASPAFAQTYSAELDLPITLNTDYEMYNHSDVIKVNGTVKTLKPDIPITLIVITPQGNYISPMQLSVDSTNSFSAMLDTSGFMWEYDGRYTIKVQYGESGVTNKAYIDLVGGTISNRIGMQDDKDSMVMIECNNNEISTGYSCVPYTISGASITSASTTYADQSRNLLLVEIDATDDGIITLEPNRQECNDSNYIVLVDNQDWDDFNSSDGKLSIHFFAENTSIEVIGVCVVPEFGGIVSAVLVIAIIAVISSSVFRRISIMPKY